MSLIFDSDATDEEIYVNKIQIFDHNERVYETLNQETIISVFGSEDLIRGYFLSFTHTFPVTVSALNLEKWRVKWFITSESEGEMICFDPDFSDDESSLSTIVEQDMQCNKTPDQNPTPFLESFSSRISIVEGQDGYVSAVQWVFQNHSIDIVTVNSATLFLEDGAIFISQADEQFLMQIWGSREIGSGSASGLVTTLDMPITEEAFRGLFVEWHFTNVQNDNVRCILRGTVGVCEVMDEVSSTPTSTPTPLPTPTPAAEKPYTTFGDGTWIVGEDIESGTYQTQNSDGICYWERLIGLSGELDDIAANEFAEGQLIVTITPTDKAFKSQDCGEWSPVDYSGSPDKEISTGTWTVGYDILPGTYETNETSALCYWERMSGFSGELDETIANFFGDYRTVVTIKDTDVGFRSTDCGKWTLTEEKQIEPLVVLTSFSDGTWIVEDDINPGTYSTSDTGDFCYWARLSGFGGEIDEIKANDLPTGETSVTIEDSDVGFVSTGCGTWVLQE